jgi:hypothetical protein
MEVQQNHALTSALLKEMMEHIEDPERVNQHPSVTDLIDCLTKTYYNTEDGGKLEMTDQTKMYFLVGLALESALLPKRKEKPLYGVTDGIHYHVDSQDGDLIELKSTRMSIKNVEEEFSPRWLRQVKGYLYAIGQRAVDIGVIYIIPGDFRVYRVTFTQMELDIHWDWMKKRRDVWNQAKIERQAPKAFAYNDGASRDSWECKSCQYKMICDVRSRMGL